MRAIGLVSKATLVQAWKDDDIQDSLLLVYYRVLALIAQVTGNATQIQSIQWGRVSSKHEMNVGEFLPPIIKNSIERILGGGDLLRVVKNKIYNLGVGTAFAMFHTAGKIVLAYLASKYYESVKKGNMDSEIVTLLNLTENRTILSDV
jgi:hypothetical protein